MGAVVAMLGAVVILLPVLLLLLLLLLVRLLFVANGLHGRVANAGLQAVLGLHGVLLGEAHGVLAAPGLVESDAGLHRA
jgi:hypothetical protein